MSSMSVRLEARTGYTIPGKRTPSSTGIPEDPSGDFEVELFLITVSGLQKLLGKSYIFEE